MSQKDIIIKASQLFLRKGYKTITMDDIATELAMSKKTLYEEFGNKENLIEEVIKIQFEEVSELFQNVLSLNLNAVEELFEIKTNITDRFSRPHHKNAVFQLQKYYKKIYQKVYLHQFEIIEKWMVRNIEKGKGEGLYRESLNSKKVAEIILLTQNSIKTNEKFYNDLENMKCISKTHFDLMIRGMLTIKGLELYNQKIENHL